MLESSPAAMATAFCSTDVGLRTGLTPPAPAWPRELSPGFFDCVLGALRAHGFTGPVREFENLGRDVLMSDAVARRAVAEARAFSVAFATMYDPLPSGFAWRPLEPAPLVPLHMFWKRASNAAARNFTRLALDVSEREGWLAPVAGAAA